MNANLTRSRSRRSVLLSILVTPLACAATYFIGSSLGEFAREHGNPRGASSVVPGGLFIEPAELDLGEVWEEPEFVAILRLHNTSDHDIAIDKFSTSCDCTGIEPPSPIVPAHGSVLLNAKINLTYRLPWAWGLEKRPFSLTIIPIVKSGRGRSNGWALTAVVKSRVSLSALRLEFADKCTHKGPVIQRKIEATAYVPLAALEAVADPPFATVHIVKLPASPGKYEIVIAPDPDLPVGSFHFKVPVTAVTLEGVRYRCATLLVSGEMQPSTRIVPDIVSLGAHSAGSEVVAEVSVRFPDGCQWVVDRVVVDSPHLKVTPNGSFADGALRYRLSQKIAERGDRDSKATFIIAKGQGEFETIELKVHYRGESAKGEEKRKQR